MDSGQSALLNRRGGIVSRKLDVAEHNRMQACILEAVNQLNLDSAFLSDLNLGKPVLPLAQMKEAERR